jgi:hypothetical protein
MAHGDTAHDKVPTQGASRGHKLHPVWCDLGVCTVFDSGRHGMHSSASQVVSADAPCQTVVEMHLSSLMRGIAPAPLLIIELDYGDASCDGEEVQEEPHVFPLTLRQAVQLHEGLGRLLASVSK